MHEWRWENKKSNPKRIGEKSNFQGREEWNSNVYYLALGEGSGSMGLHTTLLHPYRFFFFFLRELCKSGLWVRLYQLCRPPCLNWTNVRDLTFEHRQWKRKILLNPVQQCKTQGLIKVSLLKELCMHFHRKQNPDKITKEKQSLSKETLI